MCDDERVVEKIFWPKIVYTSRNKGESEEPGMLMENVMMLLNGLGYPWDTVNKMGFVSFTVTGMRFRYRKDERILSLPYPHISLGTSPVNPSVRADVASMLRRESGGVAGRA